MEDVKKGNEQQKSILLPARSLQTNPARETGRTIQIKSLKIPFFNDKYNICLM